MRLREEIAIGLRAVTPPLAAATWLADRPPDSAVLSPADLFDRSAGGRDRVSAPRVPPAGPPAALAIPPDRRSFAPASPDHAPGRYSSSKPRAPSPGGVSSPEIWW